VGAFLASCNGDKDKTTAADAGKPAATAVDTPAVDLPYKADFSSSFSTDVSDADLKMVLTSYKDWADANYDGMSKALGDTLSWDMTTGAHFNLPNSGIIKLWKTYRDSLSSVRIVMDAWHKMYATDKKLGFVVTWYNEYDTYKNGKVDSAAYHDINLVKNGKIVALEQYKRPLKP
jgi:hypothetical protein